MLLFRNSEFCSQQKRGLFINPTFLKTAARTSVTFRFKAKLTKLNQPKLMQLRSKVVTFKCHEISQDLKSAC